MSRRSGWTRSPVGRSGNRSATLTRRGSTILLTTHYLDEAEALSQRLYIVERGRVLVDGTAATLKQEVGGLAQGLHPGRASG